MMPEASNVSIEWSRCCCRTSANVSSGVRCGIAYVKRLETGAVLIEGLVVVLDELLWDRDQPRFATGVRRRRERLQLMARRVLLDTYCQLPRKLLKVSPGAHGQSGVGTTYTS